jgi:hypothetical protein
MTAAGTADRSDGARRWGTLPDVKRYKLVGETIVPLLGTEPEEHAELLSEDVNGVTVCTKFLGYSLSGVEPPPDLFETMVYSTPPYPRWRTGSLEEARRAHREAIAFVRRSSLRLV